MISELSEDRYQPHDDAEGEFDARIAALLDDCVAGAEVDGAAVALLTDDARTRDLLYASDDAAARIDELQFTIGEGPCLDAFTRGRAQWEIDIGDAAAAAAWTAFAAAVIGELDVHGVFAFPLFSGGARFGVLELYRRRRSPFTAEQPDAANAAAAALAESLASWLVSETARVDDASGRRRAGPSRSLRADVNVAVGVLAVRFGIPVDDALIRLRAHAFATSRSIASLASDTVHRGASIDDDAASA